jgi:hypothetical protein
MDSKVPLYISAIALFIAVIASLFFFNLTQKMNKSISGLKTDKNALVNLSGKIDILSSSVCTLTEEVEKVKAKMSPKAPVVPSVLSVQAEEEEEQSDEDEDDDSDIEIGSVGN